MPFLTRLTKISETKKIVTCSFQWHYILIVFCSKWKSYDAKLAYPSLASQVVPALNQIILSE